jgi:hypothetical protein
MTSITDINSTLQNMVRLIGQIALDLKNVLAGIATGATPGGSPEQFQYNNGGTAFGGVPIANYDGTNILLTLPGTDPHVTGAIWNFDGFVVQSAPVSTTAIFAFGNNPQTTTGLTYGYFGGYVNIGGGSSPTNSGTVTLFDNTTNLVFLQANRDVLAINAGVTPPPPGVWWMAEVTTSAGAITQILDYRAFATPLQSGFAPAFPSGATALNFIYDGGLLNTPSGPVTVNAGTIALTASSTNYVQVNSAGTVNTNTSSFTAGQYPIAIAVTSGSAITSVTDQRPLASVLQPGGISATITTAKLTGGGANGSMTFTNGILTAQTPAT